MSNELGTVNSQIVDSMTGVVTLLSGQAPSQSFGLLDAVMAETLGMAMHNAVSRQQGASVIGSAAVTAACAKMLTVPFPILPPPLPPAPPPVVIPLPGPPPDLSPGALVAAAFTEAETAIDILKTQATSPSPVAQTAQTDLNQLITEAGGTPPANPSPSAAALAQAEAAIDALKTQAAAAAAAVTEAEAAVGVLRAQAAGAAGTVTLSQTAHADFSQFVTEAVVAPAAGPSSPSAALAQAEAAIAALKAQAAAGDSAAQEAKADLNQLITDAGGTPPQKPSP